MTRLEKILFAALVAVCVLSIKPAKAYDTRLGTPVHRQITVTGTAQQIGPLVSGTSRVDLSFRSFRCINEDATEILYIGGSNVTTSSYGTAIGASMSDGRAVSADGSGEYVVSDGSSVTLSCRFYF